MSHSRSSASSTGGATYHLNSDLFSENDLIDEWLIHVSESGSKVGDTSEREIEEIRAAIQQLGFVHHQYMMSETDLIAVVLVRLD